MNTKQDAIDLVNKVSIEMEQLDYSDCKKIAILMAKETIKEFTDYNWRNSNLIKRRVSYWNLIIKEIDEL